MKFRLLGLITLLLSALVLSPNAKADVCQYQKCDYQGNNRVLVDYSGNAIERYDYYPYGGLFGEVNPEQWRLYGGKELQTMNGLNLHDFHARWQEYATCWFTTQDPLAEKYYALSPYTYCADNPINAIDLNGDSISVLHLSGIVGHMALLIQNEKGRWNYYSINGDNLFIGKIHFGGREFDDLGVGEFNSPVEFLYSNYNQQTSESKDDKNFTNYNYESAYVIPTTSKQDKIIKEEFVRISTEEEYSINPLNPNHCGTTVQRSLQKAGINIYNEKTIPSNGTFPGKRHRNIPYHPSEIYKAIKNNTHGKEYHR